MSKSLCCLLCGQPLNSKRNKTLGNPANGNSTEKEKPRKLYYMRAIIEWNNDRHWPPWSVSVTSPSRGTSLSSSGLGTSVDSVPFSDGFRLSFFFFGLAFLRSPAVPVPPWALLLRTRELDLTSISLITQKTTLGENVPSLQRLFPAGKKENEKKSACLSPHVETASASWHTSLASAET